MDKQVRFHATLSLAAALLALPTLVFAKPLPSDPRIVSGTLANGVQWLYRQHDNPPGRMGLMIHVDTGSLNETDAQRGIAHFLEHMAFNGSENFAPGDLVPYFESIGMEFGADLNAFTSYDQTAFMLFTPDTEDAQVSKALMCLSDYAFRLLFVNEEIEKERGIILEEIRLGRDYSQRMRDKLWPELFKGSRFADRRVLGNEETVSNMPRSEFVDYYRTWYRPKNVTVLLVGDAEAKRITPLIEQWFGKYRPEVPGRPPKGAEFNPFTNQRAMVVTDPEMPRCEVGMLNIEPARPPTTTVEQWRVEAVEEIGDWIIGRRFDDRVKKGDASYRDGYAATWNFFQDGVLAAAGADGEPEDWAKMLEEMVIEISRAREYGFTAHELELAKKEILAEAERAVRTEPTRNARGLMFGMLFAVNSEEPILSAQQELDLYMELLPAVQLAEVDGAFQRHFQPGTFAYTVEMVEKEGVTIPSQDEVLAAARAAWARKVDRLEEEDTPTTLLTKIPQPGKVIESTIDEDFDITSAWLSNGVRVHHRFMDYKEDTVFVSIALAGGEIEETAENAGITEVAMLAVNEAATHRLTSSNIRDIMTGKNISVGARSERDSVTIMVTGSPKDLEIGLQEVHALLTDGKIEEAAFKNWKLETLQDIDEREKIPPYRAFEAMIDLTSGGDPRLTFMTKDDVERQSVAASQAWFDRLCRTAPIEVAVVGELKLDEAMPLIAKYIGSLSKKPRTAEHLDKLRRVDRPAGPLTRHVAVDTITPQGMVISGFMGCEARNVTDRRALRLAGNVLSSKLIKRIREELSLAYSVWAQSQPSRVYRDSGRFGAGAPCDPANTKLVVEEIRKIYAEFANNGCSEEELENAKKQVATDLDEGMREPRYWWSVLKHYDLHHRDLQEEKTEKEAFKQFTVKQVQEVFAKYYTPAREFWVTAAPAPAAASDAAKKAKAVAPTP